MSKHKQKPHWIGSIRTDSPAVFLPWLLYPSHWIRQNVCLIYHDTVPLTIRFCTLKKYVYMSPCGCWPTSARRYCQTSPNNSSVKHVPPCTSHASLDASPWSIVFPARVFQILLSEGIHSIKVSERSQYSCCSAVNAAGSIIKKNDYRTF